MIAATAHVWRGETPDQLSPAEAAAETPAGWGSVILLAPPALLLAAALGLGLVPHIAGHAVSAAAGFTDRRGYESAVLGGQQITLTRPHVPATMLSARLGDLAETAGAVLIAALVLSRKRVQSSLTAATGRLRRLHSGHVGDQVAWAIAGFAVLAWMCGLALR